MALNKRSTDKLPKPLCPQLAVSVECEAFACECGQRFADPGSLYVHQTERPIINSHLRPRLACCGQPFLAVFTRPSSSALQYYKEETLQCPKCPKKFKFSLGLSQHYGKVHEASKRTARCPECGKKLKNKHAVKFHLAQVHSSNGRQQCEFCQKIVYNKYSLQTHLNKCRKRNEATKQAGETLQP